MKGITNFTIVSNKLLSTKEYNGQKLSSSDKIIYMALFNRCRTKRYCYPSISTISKDSCVSERQVNRALIRLSKAGLITIERRYIGKKQISNRYEVLDIIERENPSKGVTKKHSNNTKTNTKRYIISNISKTLYSPPLSDEDKTKFDLAKELSLQNGAILDSYNQVKKYYSIISKTKNNLEFKLNGNLIKGNEIDLSKLTYKGLTNIIVRVSKKYKDKAIRHPYSFYIKAFYEEIIGNRKHIRNNKAIKTNKFNNFTQRLYDYNSLETLLLNTQI